MPADLGGNIDVLRVFGEMSWNVLPFHFDSPVDQRVSEIEFLFSFKTGSARGFINCAEHAQGKAPLKNLSDPIRLRFGGKSTFWSLASKTASHLARSSHEIESWGLGELGQMAVEGAHLELGQLLVGIFPAVFFP